jgi:hypothetical protein
MITTAAAEVSAQSLATGTAGQALLAIERASNGTGTWATAHTVLQQVTAAPITSADHAGLYYGIPTISFLLHAARSDGRDRYHATTNTVNRQVEHLTHRRLSAATDRATQNHPTTFSEYDLFNGLTGLAALLLRTLPASDTLDRTLEYLIRLTKPRQQQDGLRLPGWWVAHDPDPILPTPGGHANLGTAHGAAGILALLSLATTRGIEVDGQREAIERLTNLYDRWRQDGPYGPWWPEWLTRDDLRRDHPTQQQPGRPSWCYGAPGIARARQLAAIATRNQPDQAQAEHDLAANLTPAHLAQLTEPGLCHGTAGLYQTALRAAHDSMTTHIANRLPALATALARHAEPSHPGLLTGAAGVHLVHETTRHTNPPSTGWDACLLLT